MALGKLRMQNCAVIGWKMSRRLEFPSYDLTTVNTWGVFHMFFSKIVIFKRFSKNLKNSVLDMFWPIYLIDFGRRWILFFNRVRKSNLFLADSFVHIDWKKAFRKKKSYLSKLTILSFNLWLDLNWIYSGRCILDLDFFIGIYSMHEIGSGIS